MRGCRCVILSAIIFVAQLSAAVSGFDPITEWREGSAVHFGDIEEISDPFNLTIAMGGCSYGNMDANVYPSFNVASFHVDNMFVANKPMGGCGTCYEVQCADEPGKCVNGPLSTSIVVTNAGTCGTGCENNQINLHFFAFDRLAPVRLGNIRIRIRQILCEPEAALVVRVRNYRVEDGGYIKLVIRNVPGDAVLKNVELRGQGSDQGWKVFENSAGAAWELSKLPSPPFDLRLTNSNDDQLVLNNVITEPGRTGDVDTGRQFAGFDTFERDWHKLNSQASQDRPSPPPPSNP